MANKRRYIAKKKAENPEAFRAMEAAARRKWRAKQSLKDTDYGPVKDSDFRTVKDTDFTTVKDTDFETVKDNDFGRLKDTELGLTQVKTEIEYQYYTP